VETDIPAETFASKSVSQPANYLRLLEKQNFVIKSGKCRSRRHAAHARANDNDIERVA
jgi:hypothetical protein